MSAQSARSKYRPAGLPQCTPSIAARWVLAVAVLGGLFIMHTVGSLKLPVPAGPVHAMAAAVHGDHHAPNDEVAGLHPHSPIYSDCPANGDTDHDSCPGGHDHPGQVCQSTSPQGSLAAVAPPTSVDITAARAAVVSTVSPVTTAAHAARGSGCGPPSLAELSILRT